MLADALRSLAGLRLTDEDGHAHVLKLRPPATQEQVRKLEAGLPAPLPEEIRQALQVTTGLANGPLESFSLLDLEGSGLDEAFPHPHSIAHDGYGNYWVLDLLPEFCVWGPVLYACHDPPVIAWQAESIEAFLTEVVALWRPGRRSAVDRMHEEDVHRIWRDHPGLLTPGKAAGRGDPVLNAFAATLPAAARIADMRAARPGQGFAWGRFGPRTEIRRAGRERDWGLIPPPPKPGWLRRCSAGFGWVADPEGNRVELWEPPVRHEGTRPNRSIGPPSPRFWRRRMAAAGVARVIAPGLLMACGCDRSTGGAPGAASGFSAGGNAAPVADGGLQPVHRARGRLR
ncbi:MAG: SMI1/KNR4 family protein [Gemmatimonadales bacterium]